MNQPHAFERHLAAAFPLKEWSGVTVLVAVSGGPDSVALLRALNVLRPPQSAGRLVVAHFHHRLRETEADVDAAFVRQLCARLELACEFGRSDQPAETGGDGLEAEAREQRYRFFRQRSDQLGARYVVTGHTADDQAETILQRMLRGTGLAGLAGIPRARPLSELTTVRRPMLGLTRADVLAYLGDLDQGFREDSSNQQLRWTRNRIRHELIPLLAQEYNARVSEALCRLGQQARQALQVIDTLVHPLWDQCVTNRSEKIVHVDCRPLRDQPPYIVRQLMIAIWNDRRWPMQAMNEGKWHQLAQLVQQAPGTDDQMTLPGPVHVERQQSLVLLRRGT